MVERRSECLAPTGALGRPNPRWLALLIRHGYEIYCGFDADSTGENMATEMIALYPSVKRFRPIHRDWNDVLMSKLVPTPLPSA